MNTYLYSVGRSESDPVRQTEIKIKRSRFIASLAYAGSMEAAKAFISGIAREHRRATHNCWAYIVGEKGDIFHASDAGEPSGTAGKPMLNTLKRHQMTCVAAVVTRYYGGVKLGVRGLIEAYAQAVDEAICSAPLVSLVSTILFRVKLDYGMNDSFLSQAKTLGAKAVNTEYAAKITHDMEVETRASKGFQRLLQELGQQGKLTFQSLEES